MAGPYSVLYCDPNWEYNSRSPWKDTRFGGGAGGHYSVSGLQALMELGPAFWDLAADVSVMCMWVTGPWSEQANMVMRAWGFKPIKPIWYWVKTTPNGKLFHGSGHYTHSNVEYILMGHRTPRGRKTPEAILKPCHQQEGYAGPTDHLLEVVMEPHPRHQKTYTTGKLAGKTRSVITHSAKPPRFRTLIEQMWGDVPRVEVFARESVPGWDAIGDQLPGSGLLVPGEPAPIVKAPLVAVQPKVIAVPPRPRMLSLFDWHALAAQAGNG